MHSSSTGRAGCSAGVTPSRSAPSALVALIGNPNTGKTSLFNALTGFRRHVANYPGVTVEVASGPIRSAAQPIELLDLPGTYSLAALSPDEMLVTDALAGRANQFRRPDAVLAILDASNLPRNLYLLSQVLELGLPVVVALNMVDIARGRGIEVDCAALSERLGVPVCPVVATDPRTIPALVRVLEETLARPRPASAATGALDGFRVDMPEPLHKEVESLVAEARHRLRPAEVLRVLLDPDGVARLRYVEAGGTTEALDQSRRRLAASGIDGLRSEVQARYAWINRTIDGLLHRPSTPIRTWSDRIDAILTHRMSGGVFLAAVLFLVFQAIFSWAMPVMEAIESGFGILGEAVAGWLPAGVMASLIADGLIGGVGAVLVFLPQILILFAFIAVLEDCGYMARAAYMLDRLMRGLGLSGRAFIPLLSSFACAVPAIMGTRTIGDRRERFVTILLAPFMSCSARLPVYVLMISAFVPATPYLGGWVTLQAVVMFGAYLVGVLFAIPLGWLLRMTAFRGPPSGFLLELPSYKWPRPRAIWQRMYFAGRSFVIRAGTVILAVNLIVWTLGYFPRSEATLAAVAQRAEAEGWDQERVESELAGAYLRESYLARMGRAVEPVVEPIGWDWRIGMAVVASFPAREVIIATLGTIFNLGAAEDEASPSLREAVQTATWPDGRPLFTLPVALSIIVFFALCAQCASTLVVMGRETGSWLWPALSFVWMTTLACFAAWGTAAAARAAGW